MQSQHALRTEWVHTQCYNHSTTVAFILCGCTGVLEKNEAKSQQMVAEELSRIVQSELVELRQRNIAETTTRVRLENQLGALKVCA